MNHTNAGFRWDIEASFQVLLLFQRAPWNDSNRPLSNDQKTTMNFTTNHRFPQVSMGFHGFPMTWN